jgi:hypothetical protein
MTLRKGEITRDDLKRRDSRVMWRLGFGDGVRKRGQGRVTDSAVGLAQRANAWPQRRHSGDGKLRAASLASKRAAEAAHSLLSGPATRGPGTYHRKGRIRISLLLHPGLDLVESGLGAGFILSAAALGAVCATEADRTDDIVAGHDRYCTRPREDVLVRLELGL